MAEREDVRGLLNRVALATAQSTVEAVKNASLKREDQEYILTETTFLAPGALSSSRQKVIRKVWDAYASNRIVEEIKQQFSAPLETCAEKLTTDKKDTPTVRGDLGYFLLAVVKKAADELAVDFVEDMVDRLLFEYDGGELDWTGTIWLSGVRVNEPIQIKKGLTLRPPIEEDFNSELPSDGFGVRVQPQFTIPDAILEIESKDCNRPELRQIVNALSLFGLGAVEMLQEDWRSNSIFPYMGGGWMPLNRNLLRNTDLSYELLRNDGPPLAAFLDGLPGDFPTRPTGHHDSPKWIALKNYFLALHTATDVTERITQAVVSLESILLSDEEKQELTFKLSLRTASLLRFAGLDPVQVYNDMGTAYRVRSKYSHGAEIKKPLLETAKELCPTIMNYARLAVIKFIQFPEPKERKEILFKLDLSLLDNVEREKLGARLSGGLWTNVAP